MARPHNKELLMNKNIDIESLDKLYDEQVKAQSQQSLDEWIASKESNYEHRMVKHVLTKLGLSDNITALLLEYRSMTGDKEAGLNFNWFNSKYPNFPIKLSSTSWAKSHEISIADLYKRFTTTVVYKKYMELKELLKDDSAIGVYGLIFPFGNMGKGLMHNHPNLRVYGTRIVKYFSNGEIVYLDILDNVLKTWKP